TVDGGEHGVHARRRELARERVLLRRMEGGEELEAVAEIVPQAMAEREGPARGHAPQPAQERDQRVLAHLAQDEHGAEPWEQAPFARQVLAAAADLLRERPVRRR